MLHDSKGANEVLKNGKMSKKMSKIKSFNFWQSHVITCLRVIFLRDFENLTFRSDAQIIMRFWAFIDLF